jgi:hypothetical protein
MKPVRPEVFKSGGVAVGNAEAIRIAVGHVRRAALRRDFARCELTGRAAGAKVTVA